MSHIYFPTTRVFYLAHNGKDMFSPGVVDTPQSMDSGLPILETFETLDLLNARLAELGQPALALDPGP